MKNLFLILGVALIVFTANAEEVIQVKKTLFCFPSSFSCASEAQEKDGATSSISFYFGRYTVNAEGRKEYNYYVGSLSREVSGALCRHLEMIYSLVDTEDVANYEKFSTTIYTIENKLVGFDSPMHRGLYITTK